MLARLFVIVGGLFVLALLAALVAPYFIDWSSYRSAFEREAGSVLGRKVTVGGTASARLLPFPSVTFTDVAVEAGQGQPAMTVDTFSMDAELAPLLHGEFLIFDMRLIRPKVVVDIAADGTVDWAVRPSTPVDPARVAVEDLSVTDGEVVLRHEQSGSEHRLTDIDARLSARSLAGPWTGSGTLNLDGKRAAITLATGTAENGSMRLRLDALPDSGGVRVTAEGNAEMRNGVARYAGTFRVAQIVGEETDGEAQGSGQARAPGIRVDGKFALDNQALDVESFRFETGAREDPYTAEGKAQLLFGATPRFTLEASGDQFQLPDEGEGGEAAGLSLSQRLAAVEAFLLDLPKPTIPGTVVLNLPAVVAGDTTVRDVKLSAEPAESGWNVLSLSAGLPGRTALEAKGLLSLADGMAFDGSLLVAVAQPSGFAAWLGRDVNDAVRRMPSFGFHSKVTLARERQTFRDLEIALGDASFEGEADSLTPSAERASLKLRLAGEKLELDQAGAFVSLLIGHGTAEGVGGRDFDFAVKAGPVQAAGFTAEEADIAVRITQEGLSLDRLAVQGMDGASLTLAGSLSPHDGVRTGKLTGTLAAPDLEGLLARTALAFPESAALSWLDARAKAFPSLLSKSEFRFDLEALPGEDGQRIALAAEGTSGGSRVSLSLRSGAELEQATSEPLEFRASVSSSDGAPLLALAGLHATPLGLTGPAELQVSAEGVPTAGLRAHAELSAAKFSSTLDGTLTRFAAGGFAFNGPVSLDAEDIEPWMLTIGAGLPGFGLGTPADLRANADYADGLLVLSDLSGSWDEGAVSGDVNVALKGGLPEITGALAVDDFDLTRATSVLLGENAFDEEGDGSIQTPFREKPLAPFTAGFTISAGSLSAGKLGTLFDADMTLTLDAERIALGAVSGTYAGGKLKGAAELRNSGGTGILSAQFDLRGSSVSAAAQEAALSATGDFSGSISASGKSVDGLIAGLNGSGTAALRDVTVRGINSAALPTLLAKADAAGREIDAADVRGFAVPALRNGSFRADQADFAFSLSGGVLRTPPWSASNPAATLSSDLRADFTKRTVSARGKLTFQPGPNALAGSEPAVGLALEGGFASAHLRFDTAPLAQFLVQRRLEQEQARVEDLQAGLLEKQRLRREIRYLDALKQERQQDAAARERRTQAAQIRVQERAAIEAETARAAEQAQRPNTEPEAKPAETQKPPPVPSARELNLDALPQSLQPQL